MNAGWMPRCGMATSSGTLNTPATNTNRKTALPRSCMVPKNFFRSEKFDLQSVGSIFLAVSAPPFIHRNCCDFSAFISDGNSAGEVMSFRYTNFQPLSWAR